MNAKTRQWMFGVVAALGCAVAHGQAIKFPTPEIEKTPAAIKKPKTILPWKVIVSRTELPVYTGAEGDELLMGAEAPKFGDVCYVAHDSNKPGTPRRLLLGRFNRDGEEFASWVGWVSEAHVLDEPRPMQVKAARELLQAGLPKDHPLAKKVANLLPDASREDYKNVTLKAVTHPERGKLAFSRPVAPDEYAKVAAMPDQATQLQPFAFFYVFKVSVEPKGVYCLLGPKSELLFEESRVGEKFKEQVSGWVDIDSLILWTTREAFEYHLNKAPLETRRGSNRPAELYATDKDLKDWAQWELGGRKGDAPVKPVHTEELDATKAPPYMTKPWPPHFMRYPILSSYPLQGQTAMPPAGIEGKWMGYQLCMLGTVDGAGGAAAPAAVNIEEMKKKMNDAVKQLRVFELVLVIDTTDSMGPVFGPLKKAVVELVKELKNKAALEKDELKKIELRVAVVLYKDFPEQESEYLTKDSDKYFDVMAEGGMEEFERWMETEVKESGGGDLPEEPFEGVAKAVSKFLILNDSGSRHAAGAAPVCMVFGDAGNHEKGGKTKYSTEDILSMLQPAGSGTVQGRKRNLAKIQLHSILCLLHKGHKNAEEAKLWDRQLPELAAKTGGTTHDVDFVDAAAKAEAVGKLLTALNAAMDARRDLMKEELAAIQRGFGVVPGADPGMTGGPDMGAPAAGAAELKISKDRLVEILGKDEVEKLTKGLSKAFFSPIHAVEQVPGESEQLARLKLCILLTEQELLRVQSVCQLLGTGLEDELTREGLGGAGEKIEAKIKELIIKTMLTAFGETPTPAKLSELMKKSLPEVQRETNTLPVQFGCLKNLPKDEAGLRKLATELKVKAGGLLQVISGKRERFFPAGVATGENHIWTYKEELP